VPVGTDGSSAGFAAGCAAGGVGNALGLKSASDEPEPVKPSAVWYEPSESTVSAEPGVGGAPDDGHGRERWRWRRRGGEEEVAVQATAREDRMRHRARAPADGPRRRGRRGREKVSRQLGGPGRKREQPTPLTLSFPTTSASIVPSRAHAGERQSGRILRDLVFYPATLCPVSSRMTPCNTASSGGSDLLCPGLCSAWRRHIPCRP
jgi:hypothetical protein